MNAAPANHNEPVFIHSWWRTSSTYVWGKLRRLDHLCCYSEPLHEGVGMLTPQLVGAGVDEAAVKRLHHPPMKRPYFAEYEPLVLQGDTGFRKEFSYDRYLLRPPEMDAELEGYLRRLLDEAGRRGKRPVLAFCRSSLRAAWMRRRFGGLHVALVRNPRGQWGSMLEQQRFGGTYFLAGVLAIASKLQASIPGVFAHVRCRLTNHVGQNYNPKELGRYLAQAKEIAPEHAYALFVLLWLASALQILSISSIVIDSDRLSADGDARARIEGALGAKGLPVDLSDYATPKHAELPLVPDTLQAIETAAIAAIAGNARPLAIYHPDRIKQHLGVLDPFTARLVTLALSAMASAPQEI